MDKIEYHENKILDDYLDEQDKEEIEPKEELSYEDQKKDDLSIFDHNY